MTKPETRQEMAEFIAENIFGCTYCADCEVWVSDTVSCKGDILKFAYSPDGFFAVWDKWIETNGFFKMVRVGAANKEQVWFCTLGPPSDEYGDYGKDRYDAFYSAVWSALNEKL